MGIFKRGKRAFEHRIFASFSKIRQDTHNLFSWIDWLKRNHERLAQKHLAHVMENAETSERLRRELETLKNQNSMLTENFAHVLDYLKSLHKEFKNLHGKVEVMSNLINEQNRATSEPEAPYSDIPVITEDELTPAEMNMVALLVSSENGLSYSEIAKQLGLNYGTVKNRLNKIKAKGVSINFAVDKSGERRFFLDELEKIRVSGR